MWGGQEVDIDTYRSEWKANETFRPIQHAAAAALHFSNPAATPTYPLFAIEENQVVRLDSHAELGAYLYCLQNPTDTSDHTRSCVINSMLADILVGEVNKFDIAA
ncbi:MAG: hypothetical protein LBC11_01345 [Puniceicoccales bacterium]|jgi:hypothetical protein|nr:hypothetical protein [Puniceicoccales bacterium]